MPTLDFKGKSFVYTHHLSVPFRELVIDVKKSEVPKGAKPSLEDNLIIHGDNLHALKALLPVYAGKVDVVFIDPPYNRGGDWCYDDKVNSPLMKEWVKKSANPVEKDDMERHEKWLSMMWPRMKLIKELMTPSGLIAVAIDENELFHLGCLLDDIFGPERCLACAPWLSEPSGGKEKSGLRGGHEYILIYHNGDDSRVTQEIRETGELDLKDKFGNYRKGRELMKWGGTSLKKDREGQWYSLPAPDGSQAWPIRNDGQEGHWRWGKENANIQVALKDPDVFHWEVRPFDEGKSYKGKTERLVPYEKKREQKKGIGWGTWLDSHGYNADATRELKEMFGIKVFDAPKPTKLIKWFISLHANIDAVVLDSFAGSGATAHAVAQQNRDDGGNRKFILVQIPEQIKPDHAAYPLGYREVVDVCADRVRKAIQGYKFDGVQKEELMRESVTFTALKNADKLLARVDSFDFLDKQRFDRITKTVEGDELIVTGEKDATDGVEGLGGSFTFCTLGEEMDIGRLLTGDKLPSFDALAKYVFYTATGRTLADVPKQKADGDGFIGETELYRVHLFYKAEKKWLASNDAALTDHLVEKMQAANKEKKRLLVFAAAKFMSQKELTRLGVEFCQLPYAIHRILGD